MTGEQLGPFLRKVYRDRQDKTLYLSAAGAGVQRLGVITDGMRKAPGR